MDKAMKAQLGGIAVTPSRIHVNNAVVVHRVIWS
jgi:hypothetical protein